MNQDDDALIEGAVAGFLAAAIARMAGRYLTRRYGLRACQAYSCAVWLSILASLALFFGGLTWAYGFLLDPLTSTIWLWACGILLLWHMPVTYFFACCERHCRTRR